MQNDSIFEHWSDFFALSSTRAAMVQHDARDADIMLIATRLRDQVCQINREAHLAGVALEEHAAFHHPDYMFHDDIAGAESELDAEIEAAIDDSLDRDEYDLGQYDDDPSPYLGTYSED